MDKKEFVSEVVQVARQQGYKIETNARNGLVQIDFGIKKLHAEHLEKLYPDILKSNVHIPTLNKCRFAVWRFR